MKYLLCKSVLLPAATARNGLVVFEAGGAKKSAPRRSRRSNRFFEREKFHGAGLWKEAGRL